MNNSTRQPDKWMALAKQANWSAARLARLCGVSPRTLHRHFLKHTGKNPKEWLAEERQRRAMELMSDGSMVKETAAHLGYKQPGNFARKYKRHWGTSPSQKVTRARMIPDPTRFISGSQFVRK